MLRLLPLCSLLTFVLLFVGCPTDSPTVTLSASSSPVGSQSSLPESLPLRANAIEISGAPGVELVAPELPAPTPQGLVGVLDAAPNEGPQALSAWALDPEAETQARYSALRELETLDGQHALATAEALLADEVSFVRLNALAVVARSDLPRAKTILATLSPTQQRLANRMAQR